MFRWKRPPAVLGSMYRDSIAMSDKAIRARAILRSKSWNSGRFMQPINLCERITRSNLVNIGGRQRALACQTVISTARAILWARYDFIREREFRAPPSIADSFLPRAARRTWSYRRRRTSVPSRRGRANTPPGTHGRQEFQPRDSHSRSRDFPTRAARARDRPYKQQAPS